MTTGLMPIPGIRLFFLACGGSSLWTGLISIGIQAKPPKGIPE